MFQADAKPKDLINQEDMWNAADQYTKRLTDYMGFCSVARSRIEYAISRGDGQEVNENYATLRGFLIGMIWHLKASPRFDQEEVSAKKKEAETLPLNIAKPKLTPIEIGMYAHKQRVCGVSINRQPLEALDALYDFVWDKFREGELIERKPKKIPRSQQLR